MRKKKRTHNNARLLINVCTKQGQVFGGFVYPPNSSWLSLGYREFTHDISTFFMALCSPIVSVHTYFLPPTTTTTLNKT